MIAIDLVIVSGFYNAVPCTLTPLLLMMMNFSSSPSLPNKPHQIYARRGRSSWPLTTLTTLTTAVEDLVMSVARRYWRESPTTNGPPQLTKFHHDAAAGLRVWSIHYTIRPSATSHTVSLLTRLSEFCNISVLLALKMHKMCFLRDWHYRSKRDKLAETLIRHWKRFSETHTVREDSEIKLTKSK